MMWTNLAPDLGVRARATRPEVWSDLVVGVANAPARRGRHDLVCHGTLVATMLFMRWAIERKRFPSIQEVVSEFRVHRSTAYRWTAALAEVYGIDPASRHGGQHG